jgi:hypothetical protein
MSKQFFTKWLKIEILLDFLLVLGYNSKSTRCYVLFIFYNFGYICLYFKVVTRGYKCIAL